jgi:flagellar hook protein FlgE
VAAGDATATPPVAATPRATYGTSLNVYDTQGTAIPVNLYFEKDATNTWNVFTLACHGHAHRQGRVRRERQAHQRHPQCPTTAGTTR